MKWTKYHLSVPIGANTVLINYRNNAVIALDKALAEKMNALGEVEAMQHWHPTLYEELCQMDFLVDDTLDEAAQYMEELDQRRLSKSQLTITVNPTLDCNLRCWYCYEQHQRGSMMTKETIQNIIDFVHEQCQSEELKRIDLSFFGGEPLMGFHRCVQPLVEAIKDLCETHDKQLYLSFTTNAVLLTPKKVDWLCNTGLPLFMQIPFDGGRGIHDETKHDAKGHACYDTTLDHVRYALERGVEVTVRCNYTAKNIESFRQLIEELHGMKGREKASVAFQMVWQEQPTDELQAKVDELMKLASDNQLSPSQNGQTQSCFYQQLCYADRPHNVVINYDGHVFQCTAREFCESNAVGKLTTGGKIAYSARYDERRDQYYLPCCKDCLMLPVCDICSQKRFETTNGQCPANMTEEKARHRLIQKAMEIIGCPSGKDPSADE